MYRLPQMLHTLFRAIYFSVEVNIFNVSRRYRYRGYRRHQYVFYYSTHSHPLRCAFANVQQALIFSKT